MMHQVMSGGANLGIQFPPAVLRSWHWWKRNKGAYQGGGSLFRPTARRTLRIYRCLEVIADFNWLSDAGLMAIGSKISASGAESIKGEREHLCLSDVDFDEPDTIRTLLNLLLTVPKRSLFM